MHGTLWGRLDSCSHPVFLADADQVVTYVRRTNTVSVFIVWLSPGSRFVIIGSGSIVLCRFRLLAISLKHQKQFGHESKLIDHFEHTFSINVFSFQLPSAWCTILFSASFSVLETWCDYITDHSLYPTVLWLIYYPVNPCSVLYFLFSSHMNVPFITNQITNIIGFWSSCSCAKTCQLLKNALTIVLNWTEPKKHFFVNDERV